MKNYKVNVNGTEYVVSIELISEEEAKKAQSAAPAPSAAPSASPATGDGAEITSPMQGTILAVNVANGDTVKKGDVLMILEAMKMENEIMAPCDGTIASVNVTSGAAVDTGATLCVIA